MCRVEGEAHSCAAALWWMKRLGGDARSDAGVDLAQPAPCAPHLNSHLPGQRGSSGQQPPLGSKERAEVSENGSTGVMPGVRLVHGYRKAVVAGDLKETMQRVLPGNACGWMKHMAAHRAQQVGRQLRISGSHPEVHTRPSAHGGIELEYLDVGRVIRMVPHAHTLSACQAHLKVRSKTEVPRKTCSWDGGIGYFDESVRSLSVISGREFVVVLVGGGLGKGARVRGGTASRRRSRRCR